MVEFFFIFEKEENFLVFTRKSAIFFKFTKLHFSVEFSMERLVNYGVKQKKKRTLIDDQKYEYNFEKIKNGTEFSKQKQRDKRTRIKTMYV